MKKIIIIGIVAIFTSGIYAAEPIVKADNANTISLTGKVSDILSGETLTGVKLQIEGSDNVEYTDFDGKFRIENLKPGKYNVLVEYISYDKTKIEKISIGNTMEKELEIKLQPSTVNVNASIN